ncbi:MAG TPA: sensor domain-containing diguanylate cyclase [Pseudomonas sp.]|nr:sensor domain-containing diguanylate cyclase [Pseudomonas sp.]
MPTLDIRRLILLLSICATLLVQAVLLYSGYQLQRRLLIERTLETNRIYAVKLAELTEDFLLVSQRRLAFSANLLRTRLADPAFVAAELERLRLQFDTFNSVYLVSAGGTLLAFSPHDPQRTVERLSAGSQEILLRREPLISRPFMSRSGRLVVALAHPLFDDQRQFLGYLGGSMYLRESSVLNRMLGKHYHRDGSYLYAFAPDRQVLYHDDPQWIGQRIEASEITQAVLAGRSGSLRLISEKGEEVLAGYATVRGAGWGVVTQRPLETSLAELRLLAWEVAGFVLPFLLLVMLVIGWLSLIIAQPLRQLAHGVQQSDGLLAAQEVRKVRSWYYEAAQLKRSILTGLELLNRKIGKLNLESITDPLTGLVNRRGAQLALDEWEGDARPFAVVLMDIDYFKQVNDQYGHDVGDRTLQFLASQIRKVARVSDVLCRSGGEEFMMLLPDTDLDAAAEVAERLRRAMEATVAPAGRPVTLSFGVAHYPQTSTLPEKVLKGADEAMYRAKEEGRNRVAHAPAEKTAS